jgi:hypothetical protein
MPRKSNSSSGRNFLYAIITLVLLLLLVEVVLSVFFYHQHGSEKLAIVEAGKKLKGILKGRAGSVNVDNQKLVRPDSSLSTNKEIAQEIEQSNKFQYEPWIEFKNVDYNGKYVNVQNAVRKSVPNTYFNPLSRDTIDIYFFGGSTTFGFNLSDEETIPSQFVRLYKQRYPTGKSIRVYNFGTPTYYSYQELILLTKLIFSGSRPKVIVFVDGVNDFWFGKASYYNQSYFSYILRQVFSQDLLTTGKFNFKDTADRMFKDPQDIPLKQFNDTLVAHYESNIRNAKVMADLIGAKSFFFCQPVPFYKYPNQQKDPICFKDQNTRFDYIYPLIEKDTTTLPRFTFLGNMLQNERGYPFVDGLHYSPSFTKKIVGEILNKVGKELQ